MKKTITLILALTLLFQFFAFQSPAAYAVDEVWKIEYITDVFGDVTNEYCLTNSTPLAGTYNSESVSNGKMTADIMFERDGAYVIAYIVIYRDGADRLKNGTPFDITYDILIKRTDGGKISCGGTMHAGTDRIVVNVAIDLAIALAAGSGEISIYIESSAQSINNYLFKATCGNFGKLFNDVSIVPPKESVIPYQEEYELAEYFLANKRYDDAINIFESLGEFSDAQKKAADALEAKNAYAYAQAETLLADGNYDAAYLAFTQLVGYKDVEHLLKTDKNLVAAASAHEAKMKAFKTVGSTVSFGTYEQDNNTSNGKENIEWIVLRAEGNQSLLISRYALDFQEYNTVIGLDVTWETCYLRSWLNSAFLNDAFSTEEQKAILKTTVDNSKSQGKSHWSTSGGNDTTDQIFLLSYAETSRFFASNSDRRCEPTAYVKAQGVYTDDRGNCWWWLRSPGQYQNDAAIVSRDGNLYYGAPAGLNKGAVRPAFWIDLESGIF